MFEVDDIRAIKETQGKIMGVDFGDVRTGLAVSDASRLIASGIGYISPGGIEKTADAVAEAVKEQGAVGVVVGMPVNMDGSHERMTTMTASRYLNETGTHGKKRKQVIDTLSAQIILQNCLDRLKYMS